ncbi:DUF4143 domain-containing protein, partial [Patescibacteria group bacterium]|nr:DUF4143 domain-containing protein [Patescibacteria group bacterium]
FGGYPRVVLSETVDEKVNVLKDIADSYLKKDIFESDIRNENAFYNLIRLLASEIGNLVNINSISDVLGLSRMTVEKYLYVLQKSFHINLISPFTTNIRRELIKMKKVFFSDIGLRNYLVDSFEPLLTRDDKGGLFENMVYIQVRNRLANVTRFWRYKDNEVDFILKNPILIGSNLRKNVGIEVKFNEKNKKESKYKRFKEKYPEIDLFFVSYDGRLPVWLI